MTTNKEIISVSGKEVDLKNFADDPQKWCEGLKDVGKSCWLLAFADDGLIWGRLDNGKLTLAVDAFPPENKVNPTQPAFPQLNGETLQHLYLFNENGEIHVWKKDNSFKGWRLADGPDWKDESITYDQILWGTSIYQESDQGFTWLVDGSQGLGHAVPLPVKAKEFGEKALARPLRLKTRQYLDYDNDGRVFITAVRLVDLFVA